MTNQANMNEPSVIPKTRVRNKPSSLLKELIDLVNLVPPRTKMPSKEEIFVECGLATIQRQEAEGKELDVVHYRRLFNAGQRIRAIIAPYPELTEILEGRKKSVFFFSQSPLTIHYQYKIFLSYRDLLRRVAEGVTMLKTHGYTEDLSQVLGKNTYTDQIFFDDDDFAMTGFFSLTVEEGKFSFWIPPFIQAFSPEQEAERLSICPNCERIYWKYRANAQTCSKECSGEYRFKKWLSNPENKEQFLKNKKAKYHQNKKSERFPSRIRKEIK